MQAHTPPPTPGELRSFGWLMAGMIAGLFGLLLPWLADRPWPAWPWIAAGVIVVPAVLYPAALGPIRTAWMKFGAVMGRINSVIILFVLYAVIIVPVGLLLRLAGRDPMARRFDANTGTYRIVRSHPAEKQSLERPF